MDCSSQLFKDSLFNDLSIKKDSVKNLNKASGKQLIEKSQFLNYKHNCKVMNEAKKSLSDNFVWVVFFEDPNEYSTTEVEQTEFIFTPHHDLDSEIRIVY